MSAITIEDLKWCLEELNKQFPRPGMHPLFVSEFCDIKDTAAPWPHAEKLGVYALFDDSLELLYLGKASCNSGLGYRVRAHFDKTGGSKAPKFEKVRYLATIPVPTDRAFEAPAVEEFLIARLNPSLCAIARSEPIAFKPES